MLKFGQKEIYKQRQMMDVNNDGCKQVGDI